MKKYFIILGLSILVFSCQTEELTIIDTPQETSFLEDKELVHLVRSVSAHDGRFDDVIDKSSCFSINFPYQISIDNEVFQINTVDDLLLITTNDAIAPVFPITVSFANHMQAEVTSTVGFTALVENCENGTLFNDRIVCVDFVYPIMVAVYNSASSDFETVQLDHDQNTFETITDFEANTLASINYPIELVLSTDIFITIESNAVLKETILEHFNFCE